MNQQQNSIELISVTFNAGESRLFALSGEYFEVIDAPNPVDVLLSDFNGAQRARMNQAAASFYSKGVAYGVIQITSASAQTIRFAYGTGETGTRRSTGSVTVSGAIALDAGTLAALEITNVRPEPHTGSYAATGALAANTAEAIFLAGANPNGAIIQGLEYSFMDNATPSAISAFVAKATTPANMTDGLVLGCAKPSVLGSNQLGFQFQLNKDIFLPANLGLYFISPAALPAQQSHFRAARWRAL